MKGKESGVGTACLGCSLYKDLELKGCVCFGLLRGGQVGIGKSWEREDLR